jgi:predicted small lipoprotein YifL
MKKILAIMLVLAMALAFAACNQEQPNDSTEDTTVADVENDDTTVEEDTTVEDTTEEETTEEETTEELDLTPETIPSNNNDGYDFLYMRDRNSNAATNPLNLLPSKEVGVHIKLEEGIVEAVCFAEIPNWGDAIGGFTLSFYAWNTDYKTTVAGTPICEQVYESIPDASELVYTPSAEIGPGEYLFLIHNPVDAKNSGIGIYNQQASNLADSRFVEGFLNGKSNAKVGPDAYFVIYLPEQE